MSENLKRLTTDVIVSYVANNAIAAKDLPGVIESVFAALNGVDRLTPPETETFAKATPGEIRKSVAPDALISFIDGRSYKMLKRHLAGHGMTPATYREAFGLPKDYPMTAPAYSEARSALARSIGLGAKGRLPATAPDRKPRVKKVPAPAVEPETLP
jgi:predicted transcriptional regulator